MTYRALMILLITLIVFTAATLAPGCGDDDDDDGGGGPSVDDDDDDNATDDDDDDVTPDADKDETYQACVEFYRDCVELEDDIPEEYCGLVDEAFEEGQCQLNAVAAWLDCLTEVVQCGDWAAANQEIDACNAQLLADRDAC